MKYAILHGNYNIYHADFESYEEAKAYYDELVEEEGWLNDLKLCEILESHEAPEREHEPLTNGRHFNLDTAPSPTTESQNDIAKNWQKAMKKIYSPWFDRGKY